MKSLYTILTACLIHAACQATILTVSNNATFPGQYATVQAAVNAASAGDTVYVYPSPSIYNENVTFSKKLTIIGSGSNPMRPTKLTSIIYQVTITGSAAAGSALLGLYVTGTVNVGDIDFPINNFIISDCRLDAVCYFSGNNMLIENCVFYSGYSTGNGFQVRNYGATGNIIQNNYIHGYIALRPGTNTIIRNNVFASGDANTLSFSDIQFGETWGPAVQILNNIFYKSDPAGLRSVSNACEFKNNIYYLTADPPPANGLSSGNLNANPQFVNFPTAGGLFSFDYDFHLLPVSPGINYGTDGRDVGMWGGFEPVNAGFEPPIPKIYGLSVNNSTVPVGGNLQVTIKISKAH